MSKPMAESVAEQAIRGRGYRVYLPMTSKMIRGRPDETGRRNWARQGEVVMRPAFRGYLFAELWPDQQWRWMLDSREARGVDGVILRGERPALLKGALIDAMRAAEDAGEFDEPRGFRLPEHKFSKRRDDLPDGEIVRVESGPFSAFLGQLASQDDQGRARVLLNIFGRETPYEIMASELSLVGC